MIEKSILAWVEEAQKWCKVDTASIARAVAEEYTLDQVRNALQRLRRARKIVFEGNTRQGYWRVV